MARPVYVASVKDRATVRALASYGIPQDKIAAVVAITAKTLRKHFALELEIASTEANGMVAQGLFRAATDWMKPPAEGRRPIPLTREAAICMMFWLKTRAGWSERITVDGRVKSSTTTEVTHTLNERDREALAIMASLESTLAGGPLATAGLEPAGAAKATASPGDLGHLAPPRGPRIRKD